MKQNYHVVKHVTCTLALVMLPGSLFAQFTGAADSFSYQGLLTDAAGVPVTDGSYMVVFTLYDAATGGTSEWTETQSVTTMDGLYNVMLGSVTTLSDVAFDKHRFLSQLALCLTECVTPFTPFNPISGTIPGRAKSATLCLPERLVNGLRPPNTCWATPISIGLARST